MNALEAAESLTPEMRRDFAVVVPAFNEAPVVPELIRALQEPPSRSSAWTGEVILVDDGSADGTGELAEREGEGWERLPGPSAPDQPRQDRSPGHRCRGHRPRSIWSSSTPTSSTYPKRSPASWPSSRRAGTW